MITTPTPRMVRKSALLSLLLGLSLVTTADGAAIGVDPRSTITATMDGGTAETGNTWYELGVNPAAPTTGLKTGLIFGQTDPLSLYLFQPADQMNALMLDSARTTGTLTFGRPISVTALSLAGSSGNGSGTLTLTLRFSDSSTGTIGPLTMGDWFNQEPRVQTANGRIHAVNNAFANVDSGNPRVLAINANLTAADAAKTLTAIDLSWTGSGANTHTAIFGVSGDASGIGHFTAIPLTLGSFNQDIVVGRLEAIPEPGSIVLFSLAGGLLLFSRRQRR